MTSASLLGNAIDDEAVSLLLKVKEEKPQLITLCGIQPEQKDIEISYGALDARDAKLLAFDLSKNQAIKRLK